VQVQGMGRSLQRLAVVRIAPYKEAARTSVEEEHMFAALVEVGEGEGPGREERPVAAADRF
jgi:hypothetical protein